MGSSSVVGDVGDGVPGGASSGGRGTSRIGGRSGSGSSFLTMSRGLRSGGSDCAR